MALPALNRGLSERLGPGINLFLQCVALGDMPLGGATEILETPGFGGY